MRSWVWVPRGPVVATETPGTRRSASAAAGRPRSSSSGKPSNVAETRRILGLDRFARGGDDDLGLRLDGNGEKEKGNGHW